MGSVMTIHPASYKLDALAAGSTDDATLVHVQECAQCTDYVEKLTAEIAAATSGAAEEDAFMAKLDALNSLDARSASETVKVAPARVVRMIPYATAVVALAAALFLYVRAVPRVATQSEDLDSPSAVRFKGGMQLAIVRDRNGVQERFTDVAFIQAGDRIRAEIATDQEGPLEVGILQADGTYLPLLAPTALPLGTHFSDRAARVDEHPSAGWVIAGHPDAVKHARESKDLARVRVIPIRVQ